MKKELEEFFAQYFPQLNVNVTHNTKLNSFDVEYTPLPTPTTSDVEAATVSWFRDKLLTNWATYPTHQNVVLRLWFPRTVK